MKQSIIFVIILTFINAQTGSEIYLFDLLSVDDKYAIANPVNISDNPGYDNQPSFMKNGRQILFSSTRDGQQDICLYHIKSGKKTWMTDTQGSEYSPLQIGTSNAFSAIRLDLDGTQLLYKYSMYSGKPKVLVKDLKIGYHCWIDRKKLITFVLGDPHTLQLNNIQSNSNRVMDNTIGRTILKLPKSNRVAYISKKEKQWMINQIDPKSGEIEMMIHTLKGSEDFAVTHSGVLIMGKGSELYNFDPYNHTDWVKIGDVSDYGLSGITRIAISTKGDRITIVVSEDSVEN
jgi:Tol biopolymer transport system component